jgi:hypothetical protein
LSFRRNRSERFSNPHCTRSSGADGAAVERSRDQAEWRHGKGNNIINSINNNKKQQVSGLLSLVFRPLPFLFLLASPEDEASGAQSIQMLSSG